MLKRGSGEQGVGLIEVLVALLVISFGVLAAVALQLVSKRNAIDAQGRSDGSYLAYDMLERMRSNNREAALSTYLSAGTLGGGSRGSSPGTNCRTTNCTPVQLASYDLWQWEQLIDGSAERVGTTNAGGLDSARACITGPAGGTSGVYQITVVWRGGGRQPDNTAVTCAADAGLYGTDNEYRRSLQIDAYIAAR